jgi:hypothetical protein
MAAPVNTVAPAITGTVEVGETLTCSTGTWTGGVKSYAYQWHRVNDSDEEISGATASTYVITSTDCDHTLYCTVTATNNTGSTAANSAETIDVPEDWFIVEDGTGMDDAVSYVSTAAADQYHGRRGNTTWTALTCGQKKAALVKATAYMRQLYRMRWKGSLINSTQALDWPRQWVLIQDYEPASINGAVVLGGDYYYPSNAVPQEVKDAACEAALGSVSGDLLAEQGQAVTSEQVGPLKVEYAAGSLQRRKFPAVDGLLAPLLKSSGVSVVRT